VWVGMEEVQSRQSRRLLRERGIDSLVLVLAVSQARPGQPLFGGAFGGSGFTACSPGELVRLTQGIWKPPTPGRILGGGAGGAWSFTRGGPLTRSAGKAIDLNDRVCSI